MQLTHKIKLNPTTEQRDYFQKASGTSRFVWNWALAKWKEHYESGKKPNAMVLKKEFNAIKYKEYPWMKEIHRDSHAQPFAYLARAWNRFFDEIKKNKGAHEPRFKKKNKSRDSFYIANDKFHVNEKTIRLPKIGFVEMTESLRFSGKILGATVSRRADRWFVAIQVEVPDEKAKKTRVSDEIEGIDFGIKAAVTLSDGESIVSPRPLKSALRRLKICGRSVSRKCKEAKKSLVLKQNEALAKGTRLPVSNNRKKSSLKLAKLHARIVNLRADFTHKLTTRFCRENQAIVIEDLNVAGMLRNEKLARAISDVGLGEMRRQLEYKANRYDTRIIIANRFYPSSKLCSICDWKNKSLTLKDREWICQNCGTIHDRDQNAAMNLKRLATINALPVASQAVTNGTE
ncbi:MAG TPA: RNA-guided endonuclease TnpB family protein [Gammaproteobacteria bacterium]|nr:RNA-guided endonuclease TnpB family protein [Gammaproteobacteria bacterium]